MPRLDRGVLTDTLCGCGCGARTRLRNNGTPARFVHGHHARRPVGDLYAIAASGCWEWNGKLDKDGYGKIERGGKSHRAHRWMYKEHVGPVADNHDLHHVCENKRCVNPDHLQPLPKTQHLYLRSSNRLNVEDARLIRREHRGGWKESERLAEHYGVTAWSINNVMTRRTWKEA